MSRGSARISPTAHYTGQVWVRKGLAPKALGTWQGRLLFNALEPFVRLASPVVGGQTIETMLLARHRAIDEALEAAIAAGQVQQVVEVASGLSGRGVRFARRHPGLCYIEADLPKMAERKRAALTRAGFHGGNLQVVAIDALADAGPLSLGEAIAPRLDRNAGTAIVTEGLIPYFDESTVRAMWRRFASLLAQGPHGLYLSDAYLRGDTGDLALVRTFVTLLGAFARGRVHLHFDTPEQAVDALLEAGFAEAHVDTPADAPPGPRSRPLVRILTARSGSA